MQEKKSLTAIIKATDECSLGCVYCYRETDGTKREMPIALAQRSLEELGEVNHPGTSEIIWHGGEPLSRGLDFFEQVAWAQYWLNRTLGYRFTNSIQTNGTLVDDEVIDFCKRHDFSLGFSLDGPAIVQGKTRPYLDGRNSFEDSLRGLSLARKAGIANGAIAIVNKLTLPFLDEIYDFFKKEELGLKLNPLIRAGSARRNIATLGITPIEYADAMIHLFDRYFQDLDFKGRIDPFDTIMGNVSIGQAYGCCAFSENCQENFISIASDGKVYPCGRFDGLHDFVYGDINQESLTKILDSPKRKALLVRSPETVRGCAPCEYRTICNSGCLNNAYMARGEFMDRDYYCAGYQKLFKHINDVITKELAKCEVK